jgi:hypothetical protein
MAQLSSKMPNAANVRAGLVLMLAPIDRRDTGSDDPGGLADRAASGESPALGKAALAARLQARHFSACPRRRDI